MYPYLLRPFIVLKTEIRQLIRQRKQAFTPSQLSQWSEKAMAELLVNPLIEQATVVVAYHSLPDEVDTHGLLSLLLERGKQVYLPSVDADHQLSLHRYHGEAHLTTGAFHIKEAQGELLEHFDSVDVVLVPGVAFDSDGHRLGRGGGYYDRLLPHLKHAKKIGLCFDFQLLSFVPTTSHDVNMDLLSCVKTTPEF